MQELELTQPADMERLCDAAGRLGLLQLPLFRAAADGLLALVRVEDPAVAWPSRMIERNQHRPVCFMIAGDPGSGHADPAPDEWACGKRLRYWCRSAIVHGAAGEPDHYRQAAAATLLSRRLAFVETTSARAAEWDAFLRCPRTLLILPERGPHPVPDRAPVRQ
jgi:hypothetical protein